MPKLRPVREHWKPFWKYARGPHHTNWDRGRRIVALGWVAAFFAREQTRGWLALLALYLLCAAGSLWHRVSCYRQSLRDKKDDDTQPPQAGDRYELIDARDTFRRFPWLP